MVDCADKPGEVVEQGWHNEKGHWTEEELAAKAAAHPGRIWLIYNEPDHPITRAYQDPVGTLTPTPTPFREPGACARVLCKMVSKTLTPGTPEAESCRWPLTPTPPDWTQQMAYLAADRYAEIYQAIKTADDTAQVYCCGQFYTREQQSNPWFNHFLDRLKQAHPTVALDGVHVHIYGVTGSTTTGSGSTLKICGENEPVGESWWNCFLTAMEGYYSSQHNCVGSGCDLTRGKPLLVTEYGYLGVSPSVTPATMADVRLQLMQPLQDWLVDTNQNPGYDSVAWFTTWWDQTKPQTLLYATSGSNPDPLWMTELGKTWSCP